MNVSFFFSWGVGLSLVLPLAVGGLVCSAQVLLRARALRRAARAAQALSTALDQAIAARFRGSPTDRHRAGLRARQLYLRLHREAPLDLLGPRRVPPPADDHDATLWPALVMPSLTLALFGLFGAVWVIVSMIATHQGLAPALATGSTPAVVGGLAALPGLVGYRVLARRTAALRVRVREASQRIPQTRLAPAYVSARRNLEPARAA